MTTISVEAAVASTVCMCVVVAFLGVALAVVVAVVALAVSEVALVVSVVAPAVVVGADGGASVGGGAGVVDA